MSYSTDPTLGMLKSISSQTSVFLFLEVWEEIDLPRPRPRVRGLRPAAGVCLVPPSYRSPRRHCPSGFRAVLPRGAAAPPYKADDSTTALPDAGYRDGRHRGDVVPPFFAKTPTLGILKSISSQTSIGVAFLDPFSVSSVACTEKLRRSRKRPDDEAMAVVFLPVEERAKGDEELQEDQERPPRSGIIVAGTANEEGNVTTESFRCAGGRHTTSIVKARMVRILAAEKH